MKFYLLFTYIRLYKRCLNVDVHVHVHISSPRLMKSELLSKHMRYTVHILYVVYILRPTYIYITMSRPTYIIYDYISTLNISYKCALIRVHGYCIDFGDHVGLLCNPQNFLTKYQSFIKRILKHKLVTKANLFSLRSSLAKYVFEIQEPQEKSNNNLNLKKMNINEF